MVACRLLREPRTDLNQLPRKWLGELLGAVRARGQHRNDIVRRSAGLPFALMGLFLAEPPGSHKVRPFHANTPVTALQQLYGKHQALLSRETSR